MSRLAQGGRCGLNPTCSLYEQVGAGNIIHYGKSRQGQQRYQCTECRQLIETLLILIGFR